MVACSGAFGGGSSIETELSDSKLDVVVIEAGSRLKLAQHAYGLRRGGIGEQEGVTKVRCAEVEVELDGVAPGTWTASSSSRAPRPSGSTPTRSRWSWDEAPMAQAGALGRALGVAGGAWLRQGLGWYVSDSLRHRREGAFGYDLGTSLEVDSPDFLRAAEALCGAPISEGSEVELFVNGDAIFPAILETIRSAEKTLTFETYVYWRGDITEELSDAICERARAGVEVKVLLDALGSVQMDTEQINAHERGRERWSTASARSARTRCAAWRTAPTAACWSRTGRSA